MTQAGERTGAPRGALGFSPGEPAPFAELMGRKTGRRAPLGAPVLSSNLVLSPTRFTLSPYEGPKVNFVRSGWLRQGC
jgi:hypothetical protein